MVTLYVIIQLFSPLYPFLPSINKIYATIYICFIVGVVCIYLFTKFMLIPDRTDKVIAINSFSVFTFIVASMFMMLALFEANPNIYYVYIICCIASGTKGCMDGYRRRKKIISHQKHTLVI
ncbi:hypothetical protein KBC03_07650 [Patescibacteria group bacterium]|nr:hypothetical protein [Patescibacteria group bacterium]